jgi:dienelactone hydrolase
MKRTLSILRVSYILLILVFAVSASVVSAEEHEVTVHVPEGTDLPGCYFCPNDTGTSPLPAVVVAAGAGGVKLTQYKAYCRKLARRGFVALLVDGSNFPQSLTPGADTWRKMPYHLWSWVNHVMVAFRLAFGHNWYVNNIRAAVDYISSSPEVIPGRVAISGFSQSANAALAEASRDSRVKCVVWNNGGWPWIMTYDPKRLPPVLIFHGEEDGVYNVKYARKLASQLRSARKDCECYIYPNQRHMFTVYYDLDSPPKSPENALNSSFERLVAFLDRILSDSDCINETTCQALIQEYRSSGRLSSRRLPSTSP